MIERDAGLCAAIAAAGGARALARKMDGAVSRQAIEGWARVPQARVFAVSAATGVAPTTLRPDLEDWIYLERRRQRFEAARETFGLARLASGAAGDPVQRGVDELSIDILVTLAAIRFVAADRQMPPARIMAGRERRELAAKSWAMALAHVVGRARSSAVGLWFGTSRQNVDNACERYLRARDGDDPDDFLEGDWTDGRNRVLERGRVRRAKDAKTDFWEAERAFAAQLEPVEPERRRA